MRTCNWSTWKFAEGLQQLLNGNAIHTILTVLDDEHLSADSLASALLTLKRYLHLSKE